MKRHSSYQEEPDLGCRECPECDGEGEFNDSDCCGAPIKHSDICSLCGEHCSKTTCTVCDGTGEIPVTEEYLDELKEQSNTDYEDEPLFNNYF